MEPFALYKELCHLKENTWVIVDEIQKVPQLLDEVHRLIENNHLRFVLSGSSARKLKTGGINLLAGRAHLTHLYPLVSAEVHFDLSLQRVLQFGMLPAAFTAENPQAYLRSYAETYLQEEIKGEALTRNIGGFARFLEVAARQNGQITNISNIARDAQVARQTVQGYFDILQDTLMGYWLNSWKLKRATKQISHPKFYLFDSGVARALSGRLPYLPSPEEMGALLETYILHEVRAYLEYSSLHYPLHYWSSHDGVEVDIFCETKSGYLALKCKSSGRWDNRYGKGLQRIRSELHPKNVECIGLYTGEREYYSGDIRILPVIEFLKLLWAGEIIA